MAPKLVETITPRHHINPYLTLSSLNKHPPINHPHLVELPNVAPRERSIIIGSDSSNSQTAIDPSIRRPDRLLLRDNQSILVGIRPILAGPLIGSPQS